MPSFLQLDSTDFLLLDGTGDQLLLEADTPPATTRNQGWFWWEAEQLKRDEDDVIQTVVMVLTNLL
jgi:hypothetical protein